MSKFHLHNVPDELILEESCIKQMKVLNPIQSRRLKTPKNVPLSLDLLLEDFER